MPEISIISKRNYSKLKKLYKSFSVSKSGSICLAIGGDGTFIKAASEFEGPILPIRSNEKNSTGYYADVSLDDMDRVIDCLKKKRYNIEELSRKIELTYDGKRYYGVNEILLRNVREEIYFRLNYREHGELKSLYPYIISGDGFLVTTNVGSTAYNRTSNGPIILDNRVLCLTPLSIENPLRNPIILRNDEIIEATVEKGRGELSFDGIGVASVGMGSKFSIRLSNKRVNIVKLDGMKEDFSEKLLRIIKSKMNENHVA
jgi:NAD+ kinase